ncbi:uncharacterized protein N7479_007761 [Penicillium vulpinum]|uniref:uncharacterized protein n=1 Tax=Penicillium vulpinum TaxID=29845 RepID=UPI002547F643|nr:uncharacterized protein N7479_007761 [Penicillium vulpinum]KAJ5960611.1 hypothetical protein N7479_007761 [Penicillium vulpinum]
MADPYAYNSNSTTPSGVGYYPPEDQSQYPAYGHQPYGTQEPHYNPGSEHYQPSPNPNQAYAPQQSSYHLAPDPYGSSMERSYTPTGQPDYLGPVTPTEHQNTQDRIPENAGYYNNHPADQPRYVPSTSPHPPGVYVSEPEDSQHDGMGEQRSDTDTDADRGVDRGLGGSLAGGVAGYYLGHKKEHGLLGAIGGALLGNFLEDKVKDHKKQDDDSQDENGHDHMGTLTVDTLTAGTLTAGTLTAGTLTAGTLTADTLIVPIVAAIRGTTMRMNTE